MAKKNSKREKITFETINGFKSINGGHILKPGAKLSPRDITKEKEADEKKVKEDLIRYEKDLKEEEIRFKNLPCPSCKNKKKEINIISHIDGPTVYGGHNNRAVVLAEYCICQGCGIMYVDLNKKKVTPPYSGMFSTSLYNRNYY